MRQAAGVEAKPKSKPAAVKQAATDKWNALLKTQRKGKTIDITLANVLKPPRTVLFEDPIEKRARAFYTIKGTPQRLSEQCLLATGHTNAWVCVLKFAWEQYCADNTDETCPWDWSKVDLSKGLIGTCYACAHINNVFSISDLFCFRSSKLHLKVQRPPHPDDVRQ